MPTTNPPFLIAARETKSGRPVVAPVMRTQPRFAMAAPSLSASPPKRDFSAGERSPPDAPMTPTVGLLIDVYLCPSKNAPMKEQAQKKIGQNVQSRQGRSFPLI